jgi:hypothetical protein
MHLNGGAKFFGYIHRCVEHPRLTRRDIYDKKDKSVTSTWRVDGEDVADLAAAVERLNTPAVLTLDEAAALALIPTEFTNLRAVENIVAGCERPSGAIMPNTPHSRAHDVMRSLQAKGAIEYGRSPERSDGLPWADSVPEHLRYSPTVRRAAP